MIFNAIFILYINLLCIGLLSISNKKIRLYIEGHCIPLRKKTDTNENITKKKSSSHSVSFTNHKNQ